MTHVVVAMSGGVDSSVAAALLVEEGHDVLGVTMRLTPDDHAAIDAEAVCRAIDIPHRVVDMSEDFERLVIAPFADDYAHGRTPNPCVICNDRVKMGLLLDEALEMGAERLATGHYARIVERDGCFLLAKPADPRKDQTYFLFRVGDERLEYLLFPLGGLTKSDVRAYAEAHHLPTAKRDESQETCFTHGLDYAESVLARHPDGIEDGPIVLEDGTVVGGHPGIVGFTIGQRRGLGVSSDKPLYVLAIRAEDRTVVIGPRERLLKRHIEAADVRWFSHETQGRCGFRFRHGIDDHEGTFILEDGRLIVEASEPVQSVAPGQALVCYKEDAVLGGGTIERAS